MGCGDTSVFIITFLYAAQSMSCPGNEFLWQCLKYSNQSLWIGSNQFQRIFGFFACFADHDKVICISSRSISFFQPHPIQWIWINIGKDRIFTYLICITLWRTIADVSSAEHKARSFPMPRPGWMQVKSIKNNPPINLRSNDLRIPNSDTLQKILDLDLQSQVW